MFSWPWVFEGLSIVFVKTNVNPFQGAFQAIECVTLSGKITENYCVILLFHMRIITHFCIMPAYLASINSGSNGNCYYIGDGTDAVLIDAGISCRQTEQRMNRLGLSLSDVRAVFISHEHTDHTRGVEVISKKYRIPVYITEKTHHHSRLYLDKSLVHHFDTGQTIRIGNLRVKPFPKSHDAAEPHSFTVSAGRITTGVFTDIGTACKEVTGHLRKCHACFLESNYDEKMLDTGRYPVHLKRRIKSDHGHLSNTQALELFLNHRPSALKLLILSHLSAENNHPDIVQELFTRHAGDVRIVVASRYGESDVYALESAKSGKTGIVVRPSGMQLKLFE